MADTLKTLLEKRAAAGAVIEQMHAEVYNKDGYTPTADDEQKWTRANADFDALDKAVDIARRAETVATKLTESPDTPGRRAAEAATADTTRAQALPQHEARALALQAWCVRGENPDAELNEVQQRACEQTGVNPNGRELVIPTMRTHEVEAERRSMNKRAIGDAPQTVTTTAGGYTIPVGFVPEFERALLAFGGMRQRCRVIRTASGNQLQWPTSNDTGNTGELVGINSATTEQAFTVGQKLLDAYKFGSKAVTVPTELLQDSAFNLEMVLAEMLGERLGRITNTYFTAGSGSSQPQGIYAASGGSTSGLTAVNMTSLQYDDIVGLVHSVDPAYRNGPSVGFQFNDAMLAILRKLQTGEGNPLWGPIGLTGAEPQTLLGYPYTINQDLTSALATGAKALWFGDWSKFVIREVAEIRLVRDASYRVANDQIVFLAWMRGDSEYINAGTNPIKHLTMNTSDGH